MENTQGTQKVILKAKSLSLKAKKEVKAITPEARTSFKKHVPAIGYVLYIKDASGQSIGHVFKDNGNLVYLIK